ncbi:MAG: LysR substrate-binding domain-containing protein [Pseudomonadales bacterium]|nr:LysR substrate-binding domain-containing protein [Pseudomonadales bacterium]NRA15390.1 LysR family transcriptional regulator [Oceanospirillaceae bacterium]
MQQYDLISLRSFITVVEVGSFIGAAQLLEASTAAVSRRISGLETALGVKLLNRTTRQLDLTEAGRQFYADVVNIFLSLDEAEEKIRSGSKTIKGTLRIAAPLSFGIQCLSPALAGFMRRYPELKVQLLLDDRLTDLVAEGIDIAIRIGSLQDSTLVASHIGDINRIFCASNAYLLQRGEPKTLSDLSQHNWLDYSLSKSREEWRYIDGKAIEVSGSLSTNNGDVLKDAVIEGMGISLLPEFIVAQGLKRQQLREILTKFRPEPLGLYAVRPSRKFTPGKVKVMIEFLREICA